MSAILNENKNFNLQNISSRCYKNVTVSQYRLRLSIFTKNINLCDVLN
jgi:hypothetical protein